LSAGQVLTETPGATDTTSLFDFDTPQDGYVVKFILPTCLVLLGLIEFFVAAGLLVYVYSTMSKVTQATRFDRLPTMHGRNWGRFGCLR